MGAQGNWFEVNPWKGKLILLVSSLVFIEGMVRALVGMGLLVHRTYPTSAEPQFWAYVDPVVGMWKHPEATFRHVDKCFDVTYESNSFGARDVERSMSSSSVRRVVVLGDSFVEGFGVRDEVRLTNRLEDATGFEHLNFGASGHFSVVQSWLFYEAYGQEYDHSDVFMFVLPYNDYTDNQPDQFSPDAYRPFLKPTGSGFEVWYPVDFENRNRSLRSKGVRVKNAVDNHLYVSDQIRQAYDAVMRLSRARSTASAPSYYDDFSEKDLGALLYSLRRISQIAGSRNLYIFTIPVEKDLDYAKKNGSDFVLTKALQRFAGEHDNTEFLDLTTAFLAYAEDEDIALSDFTLGCDMHWSALGNRVAADAVSEFVYGPSEP